MDDTLSTSRLPSPGDVIARKYRIERMIGRGGMGAVYEATHELLHQTVALKILLPEVAVHPEAVPRFLNEARAAARIRNEHVATVMDVGTLDDGGAYMVMELLEGHDLEALLVKDGVMAPEAVARHVLAALEGIAQAHALGIIHRDLKPSNLFLATRMDGSSTLKVLDFGISKGPRPADDANVTATNAMLGSPLFMSPEQVRSARTVDVRTDLWSLGVIMYRLLTGKPPFTGENLGEVLASILLAPPAPVGALRPEVPGGLVAAIERCLERDRERRFANAAELGLALEPFAEGGRSSVDRIHRVLGMRRPDPPTAEAAPATAAIPAGPAPATAALRVEPNEAIEEGAVPAAAHGTLVLPGASPPPPVEPVGVPAGTMVLPDDGKGWIGPPPAPASAVAVSAPDAKLGPSTGPWSETGGARRARGPRRPAWIAVGGAGAVALVAAALALRSRSASDVPAPPPSSATTEHATAAPPPQATPPAPAPSQETAPPPEPTVERLAPLPSASAASAATPPRKPPAPAASAHPTNAAPAASSTRSTPAPRPAAVDSVLLQRN